LPVVFSDTQPYGLCAIFFRAKCKKERLAQRDIFLNWVYSREIPRGIDLLSTRSEEVEVKITVTNGDSSDAHSIG
jgi:hypothetical protein